MGVAVAEKRVERLVSVLRSGEELTETKVRMSRREAARRKAIGRCTVAGWIGWLFFFLVSSHSLRSACVSEDQMGLPVSANLA